MEWSSPFVIYRISSSGELREVFRAEDVKMAKYWLTYIGQEADVLCRTPIHPKHSHSTQEPEYWCHKMQGTALGYSESDWWTLANACNFRGRYPREQADKLSSL